MTTDRDQQTLEGDLTVVLHFDVGGLLVRGDQLGTVLETERRGLPVRIVVPDASGRFARHGLSSDTLTITGRHGEEHDPAARHKVAIVQVQVEMGRGLGDEGPGNAEFVLIDAAEPVAASAVRALLDWARTRDRQPWLPPPHVTPSAVGAARLFDSHGRASRGYGRDGMVIVTLSPDRMPTGDLARAFDVDDIPEPESLLAEARWAVWPGHDRDTKRAVLLAAIALEVKTPAVLRARADPVVVELLELLFERHDETPMSVNFLLNDVANVVLGEALRQHDGVVNRDVKALFRLRNDVAHRGLTPPVEDVLSAVTAAERTFEWLDRMS